MTDFAHIAGGNTIVKNLRDIHFIASSSLKNGNYEYSPHFAKLRGSKCWSPAYKPTSRRIAWLQIDLGCVRTVEGFETQGSTYGSSSGGVWCTTIRFDVSLDQETWKTVGTFEANKNANDVVNNKFSTPTRARYARFYPQETCRNQRAKLRVEIFWSGSSAAPIEDEEDQSGEERKESNDDEQTKDAQLDDVESEVHIPEPPGIAVTLSTELVRLRGGPYWSESYAWLRPTLLAKSNNENATVSEV